MEEIKVEIATDGSVKVSVRGIKGKSCKDATRDLERALGTTTEDRTTQEYHENAERTVAFNR